MCIRDSFQSEGKLYMVLNYLPGGELFYRLKREGRFSVERVRLYTAEIALGLGHLHSLDMIYRDLKPENLLLSQKDPSGEITLKICDFGLSVALGQDGTLNEKQGTWAYWAPEMWTGHYGKQVDMWSLGVILYIMCATLPRARRSLHL